MAPKSEPEGSRHASSRSLTASLLPVLTTTSHASALVFSTFLVVHLASPLAATARVGINAFSTNPVTSSGSSNGTVLTANSGSYLSRLATGSTDASSRWMILGRVYYASALTEPVVVWGAAAVHVLSSGLKRILLTWTSYKRRSKRNAAQEVKSKEEEAGVIETTPLPTQVSSLSPPSSAGPTLHTISSLVLLPLFPIHVLLHRFVPASEAYPISSLHPSEFDYTFVHYATSPSSTMMATSFRSLYWLSLVGLTTAMAYHTAGGVDIIARRMAARAKIKKAQSQASQATLPTTTSTSMLITGPPPPTTTTKPTTATTTATTATTTTRRRRKRRNQGPLIPALVGSTLVLVGVAAISLDADAASSLAPGKGGQKPWTVKRYKAIWNHVWPFSRLI